MRVLVTGATGFLGRLVAKRLRDSGHAVIAFQRNGGDAIPGVAIRNGDLGDAACVKSAVAAADAVVHCGARVATTGSWEQFKVVNIDATRQIIDAAVRHGLRRVVHVSSLSVYAVERDGITVTEDTPYESAAGERGFYARSKLAADQLAVAAVQKGAPITVIRPGLLYGTGRRPPLGRKSVKVGPLRVVLGGADYLLPLAFGANVVDAISLALEHSAPPSPAYTIVDPQVDMREYVAAYEIASGRRQRLIFLPASGLVPLVAASGLLFRMMRRRPPVSVHQICRTTWKARYDCSRATRELGWTPRFSLAEGLALCFAAEPGAPPSEGAARAEKP